MRKKILSILLAAVMLISVVPLSASAASSGTCGDNLTWSLNGNTLTISGKGEMYDYDDPDSVESTFFAPWLDYSVKENIHTVVVEEGVTGIGSYAFYSCFNLTSVKFSSSVVSIGEFAFCQCYALTSITLPSGLKSIEDGVFSGCAYLTGITIPNGVTSIGASAFQDCYAFTEIKIPTGVKSIGDAAFYGCTSLESITIPNTVTGIGNSTFERCAFKSVTLPDGITSIGESAFGSCGELTSISLPSKLKTIGDFAFSGSDVLTDITIPSTVTSIGSGAFYDCYALSSIKFEGNAPTIDESAFSGVVAAAQYPENNSTWTSSVRQSYGGTITWTSYSTGGNGGGSAPVTPPSDPNPPADDPVDDPVDEPNTPTEPTQFKDVPADAYYADAVAWAVENGITSGTSETTFSPNSPCTRAQAVTFLWRAAGSPKVEGATGFSDVAEDAYYAEAVKWAVANGITQGTGGGKFSPNATCNRAQIVTFMYRAENSPAVSGNTGFNDVGSNAYYNNAVQWAVQNSVTQGTSADKFSPDNDCVRAQIVTFLYRAYA